MDKLTITGRILPKFDFSSSLLSYYRPEFFSIAFFKRKIFLEVLSVSHPPTSEHQCTMQWFDSQSKQSSKQPSN